MECTAFNRDPLHNDASNPLRSIKIHCTTQDSSCICDLHHSSWQGHILNPLSEARDGTRNLMLPSWCPSRPGELVVPAGTGTRPQVSRDIWLAYTTAIATRDPSHVCDLHHTLHGINCIQSSWMESTAFNRDAFYHAAWNILYSITLHGIHCIQLGSIAPKCMESTAFNRNQLHHTAWNPLHSLEIHWATLHRIHCIQSGSI